MRRFGTAPVAGLARTPANAGHLGVEVRKGDYHSPDELAPALRAVSTVLLVSGMDERQKRIEQHCNVIQVARLAGVRKIVYTSIQGCGERNRGSFSTELLLEFMTVFAKTHWTLRVSLRLPQVEQISRRLITSLNRLER